MSNAEFIKEYGKFEFREMCKNISQDLAIAKATKKIGGYKVNNTKKIVKLQRKCKESGNGDCARGLTLGVDKLKKYSGNK